MQTNDLTLLTNSDVAAYIFFRLTLVVLNFGVLLLEIWEKSLSFLGENLEASSLKPLVAF